MKRVVKSNYSEPYRYITKHGIGPGTLPKDVTLEKVRDLENFMTEIWVSRPLTGKELEYYDIYPETHPIMDEYPAVDE